jgi:hypothetical protein
VVRDITRTPSHKPGDVISMHRSSSTSWLAVLAVGAVLFGCGGSTSGPAPAEVPDREAFVASYIDLRVEALTTAGGELTDEGRAEVLARHTVTEDQLVAFVNYHGENLTFMRDVWNDIELRLDAQRPSVDEGR